jgi:hypothetical protein
MKRLVVVVPLVAIWVAACSSGSSNTSSASAFGQEFCQLLEPCCAHAGLSTSGTMCRAFVNEATSMGTYSPTAGQACISALQGASKSSGFCTDFGGNLPQCNDVFGAMGGGAGPGKPCNTASDCARAPGGSAICYSVTNFVDGGTNTTSTCVQTQKGMSGQGPCVGTVQGDTTTFALIPGPPPGTGYTCDVADGVYCDSNTQNCAALITTNQACNGNPQCVASDFCGFGSGSTGQTCQARAPIGSTCPFGGGSNPCVANAYCDTNSNRCQAQIADGAACSTSQQCSSGNCNNGKCVGTNNLALGLLCGS